ncbi:MAG TPA: hypothetical protein VFL91_08310 [Thermomicrobiales bacterium]|nr:hypothetical protein [Thermomicrobiales bacterium]
MSYGVGIIGPFVEEWRLTVDGYRVPYLTAYPGGAPDTWHLVLDGRFGVDVTDEEPRRWLWFVANAMAVAAGYSSFGEHCRPINPFTLRMSELGEAGPETNGAGEREGL